MRDNTLKKAVTGASIAFFSIFYWVSLITYNPMDPSLNSSYTGPISNWCGIVGSYMADFFIQLFGIAAFLIPVLVISYFLVHIGKITPRIFSALCFLFLSLFLILSLLPHKEQLYPYTSCLSGSVGEVFKSFLEKYIGKVGYLTMIVCSSGVSIWLFGFNFSALKKTRVSIPTTVKKNEKKKITPEKGRVHEDKKGYIPPPLDLLNEPEKLQRKLSKEEIQRKVQLIEEKFRDFKIEGKVVNVRPGPVVTTYEYQPASGVKLSKIASLQDDLAMALQAVSLRIIAPIPGKSVVGLEVANDVREKVFLREILESQVFKSSKSPLTLALGKNIFGDPYVADLSKMPHLLVAGATGSGKSVSLNTMIISILYKAGPDEVKFIMIDPKMLELSFYNGIPHLLHPVVVDPKKASNALMWAVEEMERRYNMLSEAGVRDIESFNKKSDEKIPYIVIVIDELADLIMVSSKEVEDSITRLAQMARASGIHMIVATQRPSVDVISGLIKANFPTRISFRVSSKADSKTIIDGQGAERLLGMGDMLFIPPGETKPLRLHGAYVSEEEIERIVNHVKSQGKPEYLTEITENYEKFEEKGEEVDELFNDAVNFARKLGHISVSLLQRRFRIGYNRAARIVEEMERRGIVGPSDGVKPRKVIGKGL